MQNENDKTTLVPIQPLDVMPAPADLRQLLLTRLEQGVQEMRTARGTVHQPEDTYPLQRALSSATEILGDYGRAFADAARVARQIAEEELIEAVGDQDGIPNEGLTVPDARGDVRVAPDFENKYSFDVDELLAVVAWVAVVDMELPLADHVAHGADQKALQQVLHDGVMAALKKLLDLGAFMPGVRAVDAYAKEVARAGDDGLSAVVRGTKKKTRRYKGVKITREH